MNKYTVYMHVNNINNKKYIGITKQTPQERWRQGGFGYQGQTKFWNAIVNYGWNNFTHEIIKTNLSAEEASQLEIDLIKKYDTIKNGYNADLGGTITNHSSETIEKIRQSMIGKQHTEETKNKISQSKNKDKLAVKCIQTNIIYESGAAAAKKTGIDKSSISKCCQGQVHTAGGYDWEYVDSDLKSKYENIKKEKINKAKKPVKCLTTGKVYESVKQAAQDTKSDASNITKVCNGRYKTTNGLKWSFISYEDFIKEYTLLGE